MSEEQSPVDPATMTRDELNAAAADAGVESPEQLATKADVADAVNEAAGSSADDVLDPAGPEKAGETAAERKARLQQELADVQAEVDAEQADRLKHADPDELCPTCGQLPPPADPPAGAREIWCPTCNQRLANLIPGQ